MASTASATITVVAAIPPGFLADTPPAAFVGEPYSYQFLATGTGPDPIAYSATGLPSWAQLAATTGILSGTPTVDGTYNFSMTATNGVANGTTVQVSLSVSGETAAVFNVAAGTAFTVPVNTYTGGTTFNVGASATVTIDDGTFTGGAIFNVSTGRGRQHHRQARHFRERSPAAAAAACRSVMAGFTSAPEDLTLDFAGSMFQWTSGQMDLGNGNLTNLGTMDITGSVDFYNDGVLYNYGTLVQTGTGNLQLGTDGTFPSTLNNEAGGFYLLEGDGGLTEISDSGSAPGQTSLDNLGIIRKTAGSGTSPLNVLGSLTSTGTIEADSGTISLSATLGISQLVGNALTGGAWSALDGASLQFPSGTAITSNRPDWPWAGPGPRSAASPALPPTAVASRLQAGPILLLPPISPIAAG